MPVKTLSLYTSLVAHQAEAYPGFRSMKRLGVFLLPPGWDASPSQGYPSSKFAGTHLYTWVERSTMKMSVGRKNVRIWKPKDFFSINSFFQCDF